MKKNLKNLDKKYIVALSSAASFLAGFLVHKFMTKTESRTHKIKKIVREQYSDIVKSSKSG